MKRLIAYLFIVLGLGLAFSVDTNAKELQYCAYQVKTATVYFNKKKFRNYGCNIVKSSENLDLYNAIKSSVIRNNGEYRMPSAKIYKFLKLYPDGACLGSKQECVKFKGALVSKEYYCQLVFNKISNLVSTKKYEDNCINGLSKDTIQIAKAEPEKEVVTKLKEEKRKLEEEIRKLEEQKKEILKSNKKQDTQISQKTEEQSTSGSKKETDNSSKVEITENDKIIILLDDDQLVNNEKISEIKFSKSQSVKMDKTIKRDELEKYINSYSYVYLVRKKDFVVNSSTGKRKNIQSNYISGTRPKPNPEYQRINLNISNLNNYINELTQEFYQKQGIANQNCQTVCNNKLNVGPCWSCTGAKAAASVRLGVIRSEVASAKNAIGSLQNDLLNTEQIIYEEISSPYTYILNEINGVKEARYEIFLVNNNNYSRARVSFAEEIIFNIPSEISTEDTNKNLINENDSIDDVKNWEEKKMKDISEIKFFQKADNSLKKINRNDFYASFFPNIKENKDNSSKNISSKEDPRFETVVVIETLNSLGSGFFVKPNQIVTNFHVVDGAKRITIKNFKGERSSAKILKIDTRRDLALLETNIRGNAVKFYNSEIYPGLEVEAIGHPNGLDYSLTKGVVSNIRDYSSTYNVTQNANTKFIQTDVAINSGNSGGPLFHKEFVIGVNTQGLIKSKFEGLNFSVHLDELLDFLS